MSDAKKTRVLVDDYEGFLRVGRVTTEEWYSLDEHEKACLLIAQRRIDVERAISNATAMQGTEGVAELLSSVDGGNALVRVVIDRSVARYFSKAGAA